MLFDALDDDDDEILNSSNVDEVNSTPDQIGINVFGHDAVEQKIIDMINNDRLPHALIFSGLEGVGKSSFAFRLVRFLLTQDSSPMAGLFGEDASQKVETLTSRAAHPAQAQITSGGHPDLLFIERTFDEKKDRRRAQLDVEEVRRIAPFLRRTAAYDDGYRIVIVDDCDTMNRNSQNALLKILEEPPQKTLLILITHRIGALLPTILSRAAIINFQPLANTDIEKALAQKAPDIKGHELEFVIDYAQGSLGRALNITQPHILLTVQDVFSHLSSQALNWAELQLFAESLGAKSTLIEEIQRAFIDTHIFLADCCARHQMTKYSWPSWLSTLGYVSAFRGNALELGEKLRHLKSTVYNGNLDKRFLVIEAYRLWENCGKN
jgi:DNA polymerase III subunit delta'